MNKQELINSIRGMTPTAIDDVAARSVELYPDWAAGIEITQKMIDEGRSRYACDGKLYKCIKPHTTQDNWRPGQATASLWMVIDVTHTGTLDDPIPFALNMEVFKDKYYNWESKVYLCTRDSGQALQNPPSELIDIYFKEA
ncbi:hypothetical protein [Emergencia sp.]|uniref:hypothetical protein n=1 Tax=Emergencia sp. TaxID=1926557 RepID=UPI003AF12437